MFLLTLTTLACCMLLVVNNKNVELSLRTRSTQVPLDHRQIDSTNKNGNISNPRNGTNKTNVENSCDLNGARLRIAARQQPPYVSCQQNFLGDWTCNGSNVFVINEIASRLNFQPEWLVVLQAELGDTPGLELQNHVANRRRDGVLALLEAGRALMSANSFMSTSSRRNMSAKRVLLSEPFDAFHLHLLLSKSVHDHDHIFIKPFRLDSWLAIFFSAIVMVFLFYLVNTTSSRYLMLEMAHTQLGQLSTHFCLLYWLAARLCPRLATRLRASKQFDKRPKVIKLFPDKRVTTFGLTNETGEVAIGLDLCRVDRGQMRRIVGQFESDQRRARASSQMRRLERQLRKRNRVKRRHGFHRLAYLVWYVTASLAFQGGEVEDLPEADSARILIAAWWFYLIVIVSVHAGIMTAILTFPKHNDYIQTLDDFLEIQRSGASNRMRLTIDRHSELAQLLQSADNYSTGLDNSELIELFRETTSDQQGSLSVQHSEQYHIQSNQHHHNHQPLQLVNFQRQRQRVLDEISAGSAAHLEDRSTITLIIDQEYKEQGLCEFKASKYALDSVPMSLALSTQQFRRFPLACLNKVNKILKNIRISGLAQKWRRFYEPQGNDCLNTVVINAGDVKKIELRHVLLAFWLLVVGFVAGLMILFGEIVWLISDDLDSDNEEEDIHEGKTKITHSSDSSSEDSSVSSSSESTDLASLSSSGFSSLSGKHQLSHIDRNTRRLERSTRVKRARNGTKPDKLANKPVKLVSSGVQKARFARRLVAFIRRVHEGHLYTAAAMKQAARRSATQRVAVTRAPIGPCRTAKVNPAT